MNAGMGIGKGAASRGLALALALTGPLYANTELNDYVSCTAQGVVRLNETDFHVDPSDEPMDVYFAGVNGWTLVLPPNGHAILSEAPSAVVKWATRKPEGRMSGKVEHCRFDPFYTQDVHEEDPSLTLPDTSPISVQEEIDFNFDATGTVAPATTLGVHRITEVLLDCECGKTPQPREKVRRERRALNYHFDVYINVPLANGNTARTEFHEDRQIPQLSIQRIFGNNSPYKAGTPIDVIIEITATSPRGAQCYALCKKQYHIRLTTT